MAATSALTFYDLLIEAFKQTGISQPLRISQVPIGPGWSLACSCPEVFIVGEMIPTLLRVLCTKRSDSSSPQSGSAPKGLHSRRVAAGHRARPGMSGVEACVGVGCRTWGGGIHRFRT